MKTTQVKLVLVISDEENTTFTLAKEVSAPILQYVQDNYREALSVMLDALTAPATFKEKKPLK